MTDLTAEDISFLRTLANEMRTQNTHGTRKPIYFQILETERVFGFDADKADGETLLLGDEFYEPSDVEDAVMYLLEYTHYVEDEVQGVKTFNDVASLCDEIEHPYTLTGYKDFDRYHGCFLTRTGYDEHMRINGHNYRHFHAPAKPYVQHLFRNPELERLLQIVDKFADEEAMSHANDRVGV